MAVLYNEKKRIFTLETADTAYQMMADLHDRLLHLYYGRRTAGDTDYLLTYADRGFCGSPYDLGDDRAYSLGVLPQEYPAYGTGDYRSPALIVETKGPDGTLTGCDLRYVSFKIEEGKYSLPSLPAVYAGKEEAQTLTVTLEDPQSHVRADLLYGVLPERNVLTRAVVITNESENTMVLRRVLSASLDYPAGDFDLITFYGRHAMERNVQRKPLSHGEQMIESRRGMSSHQFNPLMILADRDTSETQGDCYAMQFVYSGGFTGVAGLDPFGQPRIQMGLSPHMFSYPLRPGESFTAPEVILSFSRGGLSGLTRQLHDCIRKHIIRGYWRDRVRPVLMNSWEGCYFAFDSEKILNMAAEAKSLGLDLFVLDDGWFGRRDSDTAGLGDWAVNRKKIGNFHDLVSRIHRMGLLFGLWFEPEMVSENSSLFRAHPDWALTLPGRDPVRGRFQLVLDFSRKDVVDAVFEQVCRVLDAGPVDYVKWDYNRSISEVYSRSGKDAGTVLYDYMLGLYDFLERLLKRYPKLLLEGCAGGGGRFDAGMLYYAPQIWCSDNTDPIDRLRIQYGTSFGYPVSTMGAHVSVSPNEQNGRVTPLFTRTVTAMSGTFGYELDPGRLSGEEKEEIREDVRRQKRYAPLIFSGDFFRLTDPFQDAAAAWQFVSKNKEEVLVSIVVLENHGNMPPVYVKLQGLEEEALYLLDETESRRAEEDILRSDEGKTEEKADRPEDSARLNTAGKTGIVYGGGSLMQAGLPVPYQRGEYHAYLWHFRKIPGGRKHD